MKKYGNFEVIKSVTQGSSLSEKTPTTFDLA